MFRLKIATMDHVFYEGMGDMIVLDGNDGSVMINPDDATIKEYAAKRDEYILKGAFDLKQIPKTWNNDVD